MIDKKQYDSDFCGSLPIHFINSIQDYGYIAVVDFDNFNIIQASENIRDVADVEVADLIGTDFTTLITEKSKLEFQSIVKKRLSNKVPLNMSFKDANDYHALVHIRPEFVIVELEQADSAKSRTFIDVFQEVKQVSAAIEDADTVQKVCEVAVKELRKISGFDGVLMYKFDENWNGTVIAEDKDERLEPYLGQTFPASDVPKQARKLYLKNPYRLIPNRDYKASALYPVINPLTNSFTDLSECNLRGIVGVHLEYMKNMGIKSSMSIRVIKDGQLWGLVSCHHIEENYLDYEICSAFEWLSAVISNRISFILNKEEYHDIASLQQIRSVLVDKIYAEDDIVSGLLTGADGGVLSLFNATGAAVILRGKIEASGSVPEKNDLDNLVLWLEGKEVNKIFSSSHLAGLYEDALQYSDIGSGMLVIPIDSDKGEYILCFRPEIKTTINWGGDPNQAINFEKDGKSYHPRNSFELWKEQVNHHALVWTDKELAIAESLRNFLFEFRTKQLYN
ncbi:MAG: GAF domain-containing protein [Pedobacter sp.]|nr:MAG: GAF domain-containing protein [Pedobacter sp.]